MLKDFETLIVRGVTGGLMAGHGAQKLFGAFEGPGLQGTAGFMESLGLQPGHYWGTAAAASELGGGVLTALGFLNPLGPIGIISSMSMAWGKAHWGKPIWVSSGGGELPLTNIAISLAIAMAGPGKYSLDGAFGIRLPRWMVVIAALSAAGAVAYGLSQSPQQTPAQQVGVDTHEAASGDQPDSFTGGGTDSTDGVARMPEGGADATPV